MRFYLCQVCGVLGLLQVGVHPRSDRIRQLINLLRANHYSAGTFPFVMENCLALGWWAYPELARLSKWANHSGAGEDIARRLCRSLFRRANERDVVLPRLLDQAGQSQSPYFDVPDRTALQVFLAWTAHVVQHWEGRVEITPDFVSVVAAREHFVAHP